MHKLYAMKADSYVKIGITSVEIGKRLSQVQTGCPIAIHSVNYWIIESREKAREIERTLHERLAGRNTFGEWFKSVNDYSKTLSRTLKEFGIDPSSFTTKTICKKMRGSKESQNISRSIKRCLDNGDIDRLIKVGKRIEIMPEKAEYDRVCEEYQKAITEISKGEIND